MSDMLNRRTGISLAVMAVDILSNPPPVLNYWRGGDGIRALAIKKLEEVRSDWERDGSILEIGELLEVADTFLRCDEMPIVAPQMQPMREAAMARLKELRERIFVMHWQPGKGVAE